MRGQHASKQEYSFYAIQWQWVSNLVLSRKILAGHKTNRSIKTVTSNVQNGLRTDSVNYDYDWQCELDEWQQLKTQRPALTILSSLIDLARRIALTSALIALRSESVLYLSKDILLWSILVRASRSLSFNFVNAGGWS